MPRVYSGSEDRALSMPFFAKLPNVMKSVLGSRPWTSQISCF